MPSQAPHTGSSEDQVQTAPRGPLWAMLAVFLVLGIGATIQRIPASSTMDLVSRISVGIGGAIGATLGCAIIILLFGGVYYVTGRKDGVTFREAVFNWPLVILAGIVAFLSLL